MDLFLIFITCLCAGFLTGLLGIGGGLIIVPMFLSIIPIFGMPLSVQDVIGISTTCVLINSAVTLFYRRKEKFLPLKTLGPLCFFIILGTIMGAYLSDFAPQYIIYSIYIVVCLISLYLTNSKISFENNNKKLIPILYILFSFIGAISASIGIGGAILFATALKVFMGKEAKYFLPSITVLVLIHALFAFSSKFALGHITFEIIPVAFITSIIGSKIGVIISNKTSAKALNSCFSAVLILGLIKVVMELIESIKS